MADDLNLPASLQRLEITSERPESSSKFEENNPFSVLSLSEDQPECFLENLSLKAICSKGNCQCNKKKDQKEEDEVMRKLKRTQKRAVLRRSRLSNVLLRAPVLKLGDMKQPNPVLSSDKSKSPSENHSTTGDLQYTNVLRDDRSEETTNPGATKALLRAPVLRVDPQQNLSLIQPITRSSTEESTTQRPPSMCAVQARNPSPDDTNIEELASYFDLFVHIPKKMSVMAEMMYI